MRTNISKFFIVVMVLIMALIFGIVSVAAEDNVVPFSVSENQIFLEAKSDGTVALTSPQATFSRPISDVRALILDVDNEHLAVQTGSKLLKWSILEFVSGANPIEIDSVVIRAVQIGAKQFCAVVPSYTNGNLSLAAKTVTVNGANGPYCFDRVSIVAEDIVAGAQALVSERLNQPQILTEVKGTAYTITVAETTQTISGPNNLVLTVPGNDLGVPLGYVLDEVAQTLEIQYAGLAHRWTLSALILSGQPEVIATRRAVRATQVSHSGYCAVEMSQANPVTGVSISLSVSFYGQAKIEDCKEVNVTAEDFAAASALATYPASVEVLDYFNLTNCAETAECVLTNQAAYYRIVVSAERTVEVRFKDNAWAVYNVKPDGLVESSPVNTLQQNGDTGLGFSWTQVSSGIRVQPL